MCWAKVIFMVSEGIYDSWQLVRSSSWERKYSFPLSAELCVLGGLCVVLFFLIQRVNLDVSEFDGAATTGFFSYLNAM